MSVKRFPFNGDHGLLGAVTMEEARASLPPAALAFCLLGRPEPDDSSPAGGVRIKGLLSNPTDAVVSAVLFPNGDGNPFYAQPVLSTEVAYYLPDDPERPEALGPPRPPVPPPPVRLSVPTQSEILFERTVPFLPLKYRGAPMISVEWTFLHWNPPQPKGRFECQLPRR